MCSYYLKKEDNYGSYVFKEHFYLTKKCINIMGIFLNWFLIGFFLVETSGVPNWTLGCSVLYSELVHKSELLKALWCCQDPKCVLLHRIFCFTGVPILLSFFELSLLFSGAAAAAATWQYKSLSVCWRLIGGDSLFVEPVARLIPNDTGPLLCSPTSFQHLPISLIVSAIIAAVNYQFKDN